MHKALFCVLRVPCVVEGLAEAFKHDREILCFHIFNLKIQHHLLS